MTLRSSRKGDEMSSGLLAYSGVVTKVRAMQGRFYTEDDFREIVSLPDIPSVAGYLKKNPAYADCIPSEDETAIHRGRLEVCILDSLFRDFEKIYRFSNDRQKVFLAHYARRYDLRAMKQILSYVMQGEPVPKEYDLYRHYFDRYSEIDVSALCAAKTVPEYIKALQGSPYYAPMQDVLNRNEKATLFDFETAMDLFHFSTIWKDRKEIAGTGVGYDVLTEFYGTKFDLLNLWYIYRAKKYYQMDDVSIYALTIPVLYKLKKGEIRSLVEAPSEDAFGKVLASTYYGRTVKGLAPDNLQFMYTKTCRDVIRRGADKNPYSIASLYSYLYLKEHEIYRLTTAMECVRYGLPPEESMKYVIKR